MDRYKNIVREGDHALQCFVSVSDLRLSYELFGMAPVQALGDLYDREFYFRSRHSEWSFEISDEQGNLPSDTGAPEVFYRNGRHTNASYMSFEQAMSLIQLCAEEYLRGQGLLT